MADPSAKPRAGIQTLPVELLLKILKSVPFLDYFHLKLVGNHWLTDVIRGITSQIPRREYLMALCSEDARRRKTIGSSRTALQIMIERDQEALVWHYLKKYAMRQGGRYMENYYRGRYFVRSEKHTFKAAAHWAAYYGSTSITRLLHPTWGYRVGKERVSALHIAAARGHVDVLGVLVDYGVVINIVDIHGRTPLRWALDNDQHAAAEFLRSNGGTAVDDFMERVPCDYRHHFDEFHGEYKPGFRYPRIPRKKPAPFPNSCQRVIDECDDVGYQGNYIQRSDKLLESWMPYGIGCRVQEVGPHLISMLENGLSIDFIVDRKNTLLHLASRVGDVPLARELVERGLNTDVKDTCDLTPLHVAARSGNVDMVRFLVDKGANTAALTIWRETPLQLASDSDVIQLLSRSKGKSFLSSIVRSPAGR